jgi:amidohydrolase
VAELSGKEYRTASLLTDYLKGCNPFGIHGGIGGNGIVAEYRGKAPGRTILLRCDMDAVPVPENSGVFCASDAEAVSHKCGHDGHMAIMSGTAKLLGENPLPGGRVVLLFQPSEEDGSGAERVLNDPVFRQYTPDMAFALHNLPGFPLGSVIIRPGPFAGGSRGLIATLKGISSHAGEPQKGRSPASAVASIIQGFAAMCDHSRGQLVTVIHVVIGKRAFGTSPEDAVVMATIRARENDSLNLLCRDALRFVLSTAESEGLKAETSWTEEFPATENSPTAAGIVEDAACRLGLRIIAPEVPFPWSEDFGHFTGSFTGALFGIGAGTDAAPLHDPEYGFPDEIIETGVMLFMNIIERSLTV